MAHLLLVRHGESEGNVAREFTRTPAVPLTARGREQALGASAWIATRYHPTRIVASPFARARETAQILAERLQISVTVEEDLRERSYGTLAGQPYSAARALADYRSRYWLWRPPGDGETLVEVMARVGAVLDRVAAGALEEDVVVVSHGAVMLALWRHVTGSWKEDGVTPNAGIVVVEHSGGRYARATAVLED